MADRLTVATDPRLTETVEVPAGYTLQEHGRMAVPSAETVTVTRQVRVSLGLDHFGASISLSVCRWCHAFLPDHPDHLAWHTAWHQAHGLHAADCTGPLRHPDRQADPCPCGLIPTPDTAS
jgi:hypothetical protein